MKECRVQFTATADQHLARERTWWFENRDYCDVFATEIESAVALLRVLPGIGTPYSYATGSEVRRLYLRKLACHLYYTFDDDTVIVRALWSARRERGPDV